jgi:hypothetical protein
MYIYIQIQQEADTNNNQPDNQSLKAAVIAGAESAL